jgi:hypothetical protein
MTLLRIVIARSILLFEHDLFRKTGVHALGCPAVDQHELLGEFERPLLGAKRTFAKMLKWARCHNREERSLE